MQITWTEQHGCGASLTVVRFSGDGRERRWARRMDRFYEALGKAAWQYAEQCLEVDPHARYACCMDAVAEGDQVLVTVTISHKHPGMVSRKKELCHVWRKGVLWS